MLVDNFMDFCLLKNKTILLIFIILTFFLNPVTHFQKENMNNFHPTIYMRY